MQDIHIFNRWTGQWWTQHTKARCVCVQTSWMFHSITNSPDWSTPRFIRPHLHVSPRWENPYFSATAPEPITRSSAHRSSPSPQPRLGRISQPVGFAQTSTAWLRHSFTPKWLHDIQASEDREARCPGAPTCQSRSLKSAAGLDARHHGGPEQRSEAGSVTAGTPEVGFKSSLPAVHMWKECEIYKARLVLTLRKFSELPASEGKDSWEATATDCTAKSSRRRRGRHSGRSLEVPTVL